MKKSKFHDAGGPDTVVSPFHNLIITLVTAKNDRFHVGQSKTKYNFLYLYLFVIRCVSKLDEICLARCSFDLNFK